MIYGTKVRKGQYENITAALALTPELTLHTRASAELLLPAQINVGTATV